MLSILRVKEKMGTMFFPCSIPPCCAILNRNQREKWAWALTVDKAIVHYLPLFDEYLLSKKRANYAHRWSQHQVQVNFSKVTGLSDLWSRHLHSCYSIRRRARRETGKVLWLFCDPSQTTVHFKCLDGPSLMLHWVAITEHCVHSAHMGQTIGGQREICGSRTERQREMHPGGK